MSKPNENGWAWPVCWCLAAVAVGSLIAAGAARNLWLAMLSVFAGSAGWILWQAFSPPREASPSAAPTRVLVLPSRDGTGEREEDEDELMVTIRGVAGLTVALCVLALLYIGVWHLGEGSRGHEFAQDDPEAVMDSLHMFAGLAMVGASLGGIVLAAALHRSRHRAGSPRLARAGFAGAIASAIFWVVAGTDAIHPEDLLPQLHHELEGAGLHLWAIGGIVVASLALAGLFHVVLRRGKRADDAGVWP